MCNKRPRNARPELTAERIADQFDAHVFTGDAFLNPQDAHVLLRFALRWATAAQERINDASRDWEPQL